MALLNAIGAGALPQLESLTLEDTYDTVEGMGGVVMQPNALPNLCCLRIDGDLPKAVIAALLCAAGTTFTTLIASQPWITDIVLELMAEHNYSWAASLEELQCSAFDSDTATRLASTLPRLSALRTLNLHCFEFDEVIVRLLVLAEEG